MDLVIVFLMGEFMSQDKALKSALAARDPEKLASLINGGVDVNSKLSDDTTLLIQAIRTRDQRLVTALLDLGADANGLSKAPNGNWETPLAVACSLSDLNLVNLLVKAGADVNHRNFAGNTPIMKALTGETANDLAIVRLLIAHKADLSGGKQYTPLMMACRGQFAMVEAILAAGADVNEVSGQGTALHIAIVEKKPKLVEVLINHGADPTIRTPPTAQYPHLSALELANKVKDRKTLSILEKKGASAREADQSLRSIEGWDGFVAFLKENHPAIFRSLAPGVDQDRIEKLVELLGQEMPVELVDTWKTNNGQKAKAKPLAPGRTFLDTGYYLMSVKEIANDWSMLNELSSKADFKDRKAIPSKGVRQAWWHAGWVPFATNRQGDYLCIDCDPARGGELGQVISFSHESDEREVLASSYLMWLNDVLLRLQDAPA